MGEGKELQQAQGELSHAQKQQKTVLVLPSVFLTRTESERVAKEARVATSFPLRVTGESILNTANSYCTHNKIYTIKSLSETITASKAPIQTSTSFIVSTGHRSPSTKLWKRFLRGAGVLCECLSLLFGFNSYF